jgi:hypothetical protein
MIYVPDTSNEYVIHRGTNQAIGIAHWVENPSGWRFRAQVISVTGQKLHEWPETDYDVRSFVVFLPCDPAVTVNWKFEAAQLILVAISPQGEITEVARNPISTVEGLVS